MYKKLPDSQGDVRTDSHGVCLYGRQPGNGPLLYRSDSDGRMIPVQVQVPPRTMGGMPGAMPVPFLHRAALGKISPGKGWAPKTDEPPEKRPPSPPQKSPPQIAQARLTEAVRPRWSVEHLEQMVKDKIQEKTQSGGYPSFQAFRLFSGCGSEITMAQFRATLSRLLNAELSEEEVRHLFNKYDLDGVHMILPTPQVGALLILRSLWKD